MNDSPLKTKSFSLAKEVVDTYKFLTVERKEFVMSKQLLRSGTAVGALIRESKNAESHLDFIHKMAITQKECDETLYWLELLFETGYLPSEKFQLLTAQSEEILKMLKSSILTVKSKIKK